MLAQKSNVGIIKEGFGQLNGDDILEKDVKNNAQLFEYVKPELGSADNVIYVGPGSGIHVSQNVIYLMLDVGYQVDISHD